MSRTTRYKFQYAAAFIALGALALFVASLFDWSVPALFAVSLILLIPGRIQGHYYRDLFRGRKALEAGDLDGSIRYTEQFIETIRRRPNLRSLMWFGGAVYTADAEAMAQNNIGAAQMEDGRLKDAESAFDAAIRKDPLYPVPFYNLAILSEVGGDRVRAEQFIREAEERGYGRTNLDLVIHQAQALLAKLEGRGVHLGATPRHPREDGDAA